MTGLKFGIVDINFTFIFQIINTVLLIAFAWFIIYLIRNLVSLPRKISEHHEKIDSLEKKVDEIYKKLNGE
ncbi:DUF948 domain-containing protein [Maledivibacter halophilus]|uniref:Uncharacterized protein n=1 Tax=Maledivibacter halophilus TaxID=36842 RepID=A0A1T5IQE5_9FIRM|nr:DUF948 domain-containing protein [Maledivibacter halophilus]SKC41312.1 hypothetical protein SAMN02194393_00630 [Maledivibacter halophilus]